MFDIDNYYEAKSLPDAIGLLAANPKAIVVAGGTDVLIKVREGKLAGCSLVGIRNIEELSGIRIDDTGAIQIGPLTTFAQLLEHPVIKERIPVLAEAAEQVGGPQLRNLGTVGGNLANGSPSADMAPPLLALDCDLKIRGPGGERILSLTDFYLAAGKVALMPGELLAEIIVNPSGYRDFGGCFIKFAQRMAMDIATLSCACLCRLLKDEESVKASGLRIAETRLAFGVAGPVPVRALKTERELTGMPVKEALEKIGEMAPCELNPRDSWRASRDFRVRLISELSRRALRQAVQNAAGENDA